MRQWELTSAENTGGAARVGEISLIDGGGDLGGGEFGCALTFLLSISLCQDKEMDKKDK